jgi:single-stranded DNA-binding protein
MGRPTPAASINYREEKSLFIEIGRLTREVEVKTVTIDGIEKRVMNNRLAVRVSDSDSAFIDVVAWNGTADLIGKHLRKGDELFIEGELRCRSVKKDGGREFSYPFILITRIKFTTGNNRDTAV